MNIAESVKSLFKGKSLEKIALDDLKLAKIKLTQEEQRSVKRITDIERQKEQAFREGSAANTQQQKIIAARKMKQLDADVANQDRLLKFNSHQIRMVNALIQVKEFRNQMSNTVMNDILRKMGENELYSQIEEITAKGEFTFDKLDGVLKRLENSGFSGDRFGGEEDDVLELVRQMDAAKAAQEAGDAAGLDSSFQEANQILRRKDQNSDY
jgi:hypothetical protein